MSTELIIPDANPVAIIGDEKSYTEFYAKVKAETDRFVADVATPQGRAEIRSMAFKVTRTKTALDDAGKKLNEEAREKINAVDAVRRKIRAEFDALAEEVRKPLTEWEAAEKKREQDAQDALAVIAHHAGASPSASSEFIADAILHLTNLQLDADIMRDGMIAAVKAKQDGLARLSELLTAANVREAEAAELARLRQEKLEREAREAAERERREQEEIYRRAKEAEEKKAEAERIEREEAEKRAADQAAETARAEERKRAADALAAKEAELAAERRKREEAEAAERKRLDDERREREAEAVRQADREHRGRVMKAAKEAIMTCGMSEDTARKVVLAIIAGEIPNVRLEF